MSSSNSDKIRVAVLFGGRSSEHEISVVTALQVMDAFDSARYEVIPVYIDASGDWYTGAELRDRRNYLPTAELRSKLLRVVLYSDTSYALIEAQPKRGFFGYKEAVRIPVDVFFPSFHGSYGEDGCIQGLLEWINAPYTGSGTLASSVGMNKHVCKQIVRTRDIPVLPGILLDRTDWQPELADKTAASVIEGLPLPLMVKPCNLGSSIGASVARSEEELMISLAGAFVFDHQVLVEPLLEDMYELNVSVLAGNPPKTSAVERPQRDESVLTFEQKYLKGNQKQKTSISEGMASMKRDINPKDVPANVLDSVRDYSVKAFNILGCQGLVRFDYLIDKKDNAVYFNEVNILPGSFSFYLWEQADPKIPFTELLHTLVEQALQSHRDKHLLRRNIERRIFKE